MIICDHHANFNSKFTIRNKMENKIEMKKKKKIDKVYYHQL